MNRSRTTTTTLTLLTALACLAAPATASAGQTIWRLGAADDLDATPTEASDEFTATGYDPIASYDITTQGSATTNIALQGYLDDDPTCDACAEQIEIEFEVPAGGYANHALNLVYARYGSETDLIRLDGDDLARVAVAESLGAEFKISLPQLSQGTHTITVEYAGGGSDNGHHIDYIKLVEAGSGGVGTGGGWSELWKIGVHDGPDVTPWQGASEFGYSSNVWEAGINFDVDTDTEADFPAGLSNQTQQNSDNPGAVDIDFDLGQAHARGESVLKYARYGSEVDVVMVDNVKLGEFGATEGEWIVARFVLPALSAGVHDLSVTIVDGIGTAHFIDMLRLTSAL